MIACRVDVTRVRCVCRDCRWTLSRHTPGHSVRIETCDRAQRCGDRRASCRRVQRGERVAVRVFYNYPPRSIIDPESRREAVVCGGRHNDGTWKPLWSLEVRTVDRCVRCAFLRDIYESLIVYLHHIRASFAESWKVRLEELTVRSLRCSVSIYFAAQSTVSTQPCPWACGLLPLPRRRP